MRHDGGGAFVIRTKGFSMQTIGLNDDRIHKTQRRLQQDSDHWGTEDMRGAGMRAPAGTHPPPSFDIFWDSWSCRRTTSAPPNTGPCRTLSHGDSVLSGRTRASERAVSGKKGGCSAGNRTERILSHDDTIRRCAWGPSWTRSVFRTLPHPGISDAFPSSWLHWKAHRTGRWSRRHSCAGMRAVGFSPPTNFCWL